MIHVGDCVEVMAGMEPDSVDAIVTDPPAGISFMGRGWDDYRGRDGFIAFLTEALSGAARLLKPGGHALVWALPRTSGWTHRAIEDAGLEVRDVVTHLFGSGFPKSLDVSKAIDKANGRKFEDRFELGRHIRERRIVADYSQNEVNGWFGYRDGCQHWERQDLSGARVPTMEDWRILSARLGLSDKYLPLVERAEAERQKLGEAKGAQSDSTGRYGGWGNDSDGDGRSNYSITAPATPAAARWQGYGTALKPAAEFWILARKPLIGTVAANVQKHGTGAINVDATRIGTAESKRAAGTRTYMAGTLAGGMNGRGTLQSAPHDGLGRWPANVILSHSPECRETAAAAASDGHPVTSLRTLAIRPELGSNPRSRHHCADDCAVKALDEQSGERASAGMYKDPDSPKHVGARGADWSQHICRAEANKRRDNTYAGDTGGASRFFYTAKASSSERHAGLSTLSKEGRNAHPTVKPVDLMRWLCRLVTPPGGTILDPFCGSGTTGIAAFLEGFQFIGIEKDAEYAETARLRIREAAPLFAEAGI